MTRRIYEINERVIVKDPADRRKRIAGTVVKFSEGRGSLYYGIKLDPDELQPNGSHVMGFGPDEIVRRATAKDGS